MFGRTYIFLIGVFILTPGYVLAIPSFARQYSLSCSTCHVAYPKLNAFGEKFAEDGYYFQGLQERAYEPTGDDLLNLFKKTPLSFRFTHYTDATISNNDVLIDIKTPWYAKLLYGGALGKYANFYSYIIIEKGEPPFFEDAWIDIHGILPFSITFGQFQISDFMFMREVRLTRADYYIYKLGPYELTYHRGIVVGLPFNLNVGVVNGNGIGENVGGFADNDKGKLYFAHASIPVDFQLGLFGLYGEDFTNAYTKVYRAGLDFAIWIGSANVFAQILYGYDNTSDNAFYGGFLGIDYIADRNTFSFLLNIIEAPNTSSYYSNRLYSVAMNYARYIYRNVKVLLEVESFLLSKKYLISLGVDHAF